MSFIVNIFITI